MAAVHKITLFLVHETSFFAVRIEPIKAVTSFWVNIKPTKPTTFTLRAHQVYRMFRNLQECYGLLGRLVATEI